MSEPLVFRYKITAFVDGVLTLDARVLRYRQGLRQVQVPYANVRRFGMKVRGKSLGGIVTSELLLLTEPAPGQMKLVKVALDPASPGGKDALAALRERLPAADTTQLPWEEAAARLGVKPYTWQDGLVSRWGMMGTALLAGTVGVTVMQLLSGTYFDPETMRIYGPLRLVLALAALACLVVGIVRARPPRR